MAFTTINKGASYFDTALWTGTGATQSITSLNFQPDWLWVKTRSTAANHRSQNSVIGVTKGMNPNQTSAEDTLTDCVTSFNSNGFTLGADSQGYVNTSSRTYVGWSWLASNSTTTNTSGSITSTVSANTTSGFSVVSYTGNGTGGATVGHGLGVAPKMIIVKVRSTTGNWFVYHASIGNNGYIMLNLTDAKDQPNSTVWNNTSPTSSLFSLGTSGGVNGNGSTYIAYCFAEIKGFSKFGSYTGNGSTDGTFVYTGFKPAYVMCKASSTTGQWAICDNKRGTANTANGEFLFADDNGSTNAATNNWDFLSNGLKARANYAANNTSGVTYIYAAFAENPFVLTDGTPVTAR